MRRPALVVAVLAGALGLPGVAAADSTAARPAADGTPARPGTATLRLGGAATAQLTRAGVAIRAGAPGAGRRGRLVLPARATSRTAIRLDGSLRLARGGRTVRARELRVALGGRRMRVTGTLGGGPRRTLLAGRAGSALTRDAATGRLTLASSWLTLDRAAARRLARRLRLARAPSGRFARLAVRVPGEPAAGPGGTGPAGPGGAAPAPGAPTPAGALPRLARPASAVAVTGAVLSWHVRDSFVQYIATGEGTSVAGGATAGAARAGCGSSVPLTYDFRFPFSDGWYDPATGTAALYGTGSVRMRYRAHGIDITVSAPEIELDGSRSRAIFRFADGDGERRGVLVDLGPLATPLAGQCAEDPGPETSANPTASDGGRTHAYERLAGRIPEGTADSVFAGYYLPGDPFGWISVAFTTP
jgi:hypothetical protein